MDLEAAAVAFGIDRDVGALPGLLLLRPAGGEEHHRGDEERETHGQSPWCISCIIHLGVGRVNSPSPLRHAGLDPASIPAAQSWTPDQVRGDDERYASMLVRTPPCTSPPSPVFVSPTTYSPAFAERKIAAPAISTDPSLR